MRLQRAKPGARICMLVSFIILSTTALTVTPALALPEGRAYEMVSPPYKGGYGVGVGNVGGIEAVAPNGESVAFSTLGSIEGNPATGVIGYNYVARRGVLGWSTTPLSPPASLAPATLGGLLDPLDFSANLESSLSATHVGPNAGANRGANEDGSEIAFLLHRTGSPDIEANFELAGEIVKVVPDLEGVSSGISYKDASPDFSHILLTTEARGVSLLPEYPVVLEDDALYDLVSQGGGAQSLHLVGLNNKGKVLGPGCNVSLGNGLSDNARFNTVAAGGEEIFFMTSVERKEGDCYEGKQTAELAHQQVFVRLDDARTLEVSKPLNEACSEVPCPGAADRGAAEFQGASEDGSRVFFTSNSPLVPGDSDATSNLYMASIGCPGGESASCEVAQRVVTSLVRVSRPVPGGEAAEVQGEIVAISPDGSRVYFIARGVLSEGPNAEGQAAAEDADNLYVYDSTSGKPPVFIADLCSGPSLSGQVSDSRCPTDLEEQAPASQARQRNDAQLFSPTPAAQVAGDGRFLLFSTYGRLLAGDTDEARDIYRYDAQSGKLDRVTLGEDGYDANGNDSRFDASIPKFSNETVAAQSLMRARAISEDGTRVVFTTPDPLSPDATNGLSDVYEWHKVPGWSEGKVLLVSSGSAEQPEENVVISPSGRDVFFTTTQGLLPQDSDGQSDIYDARLEGGGFAVAPAPDQPCAGDACQGPLSAPAPLLVPGSVSQAPGEDLAPPAPMPKTKVKAKRAASKCPKGKAFRHGKCIKRTKGKKQAKQSAKGEK